MEGYSWWPVYVIERIDVLGIIGVLPTPAPIALVKFETSPF